MRRIGLIAVTAVLATVSTGLCGEDAFPCTRQPKAHWMSVEAIATKALAAGYRDIRTIRASESCYEIEAVTRRSQHAAVVMDPVSGDVVKATIDN